MMTSVLRRLESCRGGGFTASRGDAENRSAKTRRKHYRVVAAPRASERRRNARDQCLHRSTVDVYTLQLVIRKKSDGSAVGRPEREKRVRNIWCAFGARQWTSRRRVQRPHPQLRLTCGPGREDNLQPIGRDRHRWIAAGRCVDFEPRFG